MVHGQIFSTFEEYEVIISCRTNGLPILIKENLNICVVSKKKFIQAFSLTLMRFSALNKLI